MRNCSSVETLARCISALVQEASNIALVLVGGCSRSGKTRLVSKLSAKPTASGMGWAVATLDSWLISVEKRKPGSSALARYDTEAIVESLGKLRQRQKIYSPIYDAASRRWIAESSFEPISIKDGILFVEGVIALGIESLVECASLRVFVDIPDGIRMKRLAEFYANVKKLPENEYEDILQERESEEVPFVKGTSLNADVIFDGMQLM